MEINENTTTEPAPDQGDLSGGATGSVDPALFDAIAAEFASIEKQPRRELAEITGDRPAPAAPPPAGAPPAQPRPQTVPAEALFAMLEQSLMGQEDFLAKCGVPLHALASFYLQRAALVTAMIESPILRASIADEVQKNFALAINNNYLRLHQTPGGLFVPPAGSQVPAR